MRTTWGWAFVLVCGIVSSCAAETPPYQDLQLRDALGADPAVVSNLPLDAREQLLHRMITTRNAQTAAESVPNEKGRSAAAEVSDIDGARAVREEDALLVWKARVAEGKIVAEPHPDPRAQDAGLDPLPELPPIEGTRPDKTEPEESRALAGEGGRAVRELMKLTGADHVVRVVGWPAAVAAVDDTVYVNASWLVLLAMNEPAPDAGSAPLASYTARPQSLRGNPYRLYGTLAECRADVTSRCHACLDSGACDEDAALEDFPDGRSECVYLLERVQGGGGPDGAAPVSRVDELCTMALLSVSTVAECVRDERCIVPTGARTSTSLPAADAFLRDDRCVKALNLCLSGSNEGSDAGPRGISVVETKGCSDPFAACSSACKGCDNACSSGKCSGANGPSCKSCKNCASCSGCDSSSRDGDGSGYGSGGSGNPSPVPGGSTGGGGSGGGSGGGGGGGSSGGSSSSSSGCGSSSSGGTSGSNSSCSSCKSGSCGGSSCGSCKGGSCKSGDKCEVAPMEPPAPPGRSPVGPVGALFWLALPLVYLGKHARAGKNEVRA